ncbi:ankyrin repeat-containing protein ITN1-like [Fagus crenata]
MERTMGEGDCTTELYIAARNGSATTLNKLISEDPYILHKISLTTFRETPLHISALLGHLDVTKILLGHPKLAIELDSKKRCPLHLASAEGHIEIVQELLHACKDACLVPDEDGKLPLHYAAMRGRVEVVRPLISQCPDSTRVVLRGGETVLHLCVKYNQLEALKLLVESVSDDGDFLNFKNSVGGNTILHLAVMLKQIETVQYLVSVSNVEVESRNNIDFTASQMLENYPNDMKSFTIRNILMDTGTSVADERVNNLSSTIAIADEIAIADDHRGLFERLSDFFKQMWKKFLRYLEYHSDWAKQMNSTIMTVAIMITTITFQCVIQPPGGVWQQSLDGNVTVTVGTAVLASEDANYYFFLLYNTISFTASLVVNFLLISGFPVDNKFCMFLLIFALGTTLTFLALAYLFAVFMVSPSALTNKDWSQILKSVLGSLIGVGSVIFVVHAIRVSVWLCRTIRRYQSPSTRVKPREQVG